MQKDMVDNKGAVIPRQAKRAEGPHNWKIRYRETSRVNHGVGDLFRESV
jgi:hypothetical protein